MPKALWNGVVIADASSDAVEVIEGNVYFPRDAVDPACLQESDHHSVCPWNGTANYHHVVAAGKVNQNAAWYYPEPKEAAKDISGRIAFWRGVEIVP